MSNSSIWPIDRTLSGTATPGQNGPGSNGNEEVLHIPQSSSITRASPSGCLVSYLGHLLVGVLPLCKDEVSVFYSPLPTADWATKLYDHRIVFHGIQFEIVSSYLAFNNFFKFTKKIFIKLLKMWPKWSKFLIIFLQNKILLIEMS